MAKQTIIAKNQTANDIIISDLGSQTIPANNQVTLSDLHSLTDIQASDDLITEVQAGNIVINDGNNDLSPTDAIYFLQSPTYGTELKLVGSAIKRKIIYLTAHDVEPSAGTYNDVACQACGSIINSDMWYMLTYDDTTPEAGVMTLRLPSDYKDGTDIIVNVAWTAQATTGSVSFGIGIAKVSNGESYGSATVAYQTGTDTAPTSEFARKDVEVTFDGTGLKAGDDICLIFYRNASDTNDTMTGDVYVSTITVKYLSDKWGE